MSTLTRKHLIATLLVAVMPCWLKAEVSEAQIRSAAQAFMEQVQGKARPATWDRATVQRIESVSAPEGKWHMCMLATADGPAGYVLLATDSATAVVGGFSGTAIPIELLSYLTAGSVSAVAPPPPDFTGLEDVSMVATVRKTEPLVTLEALPAGVAAVLGYVQERRGLPLFHNASDLEKIGPFELQLLKEKGPGQESQPRAQWRTKGEYFGQCRQALLEAGLLPGPGATLPSGSRRVVDHAKAFQATEPIRRARLAGPSCPDERWGLLRDQQQMADLALYKEKSNGMVNAFLLQYGYLAHAEDPAKGIEAFFLSRGLLVTCARVAVSEVEPKDLPCVVLGQSDAAGVLVGLAGTTDKQWGLLVLPTTVIPKSQSLSERVRALRVAAGHPPEESEEIDPALPAEIREKIADQLRQRKQRDDNTRVVEDPATGVPESLGCGAHFIQLSALADWHVLRVSEPVIGDNWGQLTTSTAKE